MAEGPDRLRFLQGRQSLNCALLSVVVTNTVVDLLNQTDLINFIVVCSALVDALPVPVLGRPPVQLNTHKVLYKLFINLLDYGWYYL